MTNLLNAALEYVGRGWSINPLTPKDKTPLLTQKNWNATWKNYQNTLPNAAEIKEWWKEWPNANIMMICGAKSGVVILDVDGPEGVSTLAEFENVYSKLPRNTPTVKTSKGFHYYFKHPGVTVATKVRFAPGLDSRGDGGYGILPPSVHPSGAIYEWVVGPDAPLAPMPEWLINVINGSTGQKKSNGEFEKHEPKVNPIEVLSGIPEGNRNRKLFEYASRLRAQGIGQTEAEILVKQAGSNCNPPLPEKEIDTIINSVWSRYPAGEQRPVKPVVDMTKLEKFKDMSADEILSPEVIGALAALKQENSLEYTRLTEAVKKKVSKRALEREVNSLISDQNSLRVVDGQEEPVTLGSIYHDVPEDLEKLIKPAEWNIGPDGIWQPSSKGPAICACPVRVFLAKRLRNVETGEEKIEVAFERDRTWRRFTADRSTVFNRTTMVQLANKGLPVTSESAKNLVRYLGDVERVNMSTLPLVKSVNHMGWAGTNFLPGAAGDIEMDAADGMGGLMAGYTQAGTLERWVENASRVRQFSLARLVMSASFAAPLLRIVGQRIFIIHLWGNTTGGKSASTFAALSIWGDPEEIVGSFNATKVGLERMASFYCDLPLGIDEKQVAGDKQGFIESIVYLLGLGKGKARGAKAGGIQAFNSWRTVVLTTGEEPLSNSSSTGGIKTRAMEVYGQPIPDKLVAADVYSWVPKCHGTAGAAWIIKIIEAMAKDPDIFSNDYKTIFDQLSGEYSENIKSHLAALALIAVADYYSSRWIFGLEEGPAFDQAIKLAGQIIKLLDTVAEADDTQRAYDYLLSWYGVHEEYFNATTNQFSQRERWGFVRTGVVYVYPTVFDKALKDGGFHSGRVLRDFAEKGYIVTPAPEKDGRRRFRVKIMEQKERGYFIALRLEWNT